MRHPLFIGVAFLLFAAGPAFAQGDVPAMPAAPVASEAQQQGARTPEQIKQDIAEFYLNKPFTDSLLFSPLEITLILRAQAGLMTGASVLEATDMTVVHRKPIPLIRRISLAGVVFRSSDDWVLWLNGYKVTPFALLPEIVEIKVNNDSVHLKWFDIGMNNIISISLRPHQTYDIVTGILLPG